MSEPKRHHYVPQFYLKNFADDKGQIWVYDRQTKQYRHQNVSDTALVRHYYRVESKDGKYNTEVEKLLAEIEGLACVAIEKLKQGTTTLTEEEKANIAIFAALQMTRVPDFEKRTNEMQEKIIRKVYKRVFHSVEAARQEIEKIKDEIDNVGGDVAEDMFNFIQGDKYSIEVPRQNNIRRMLELASHTALYFIQMDWVLLRTERGGAFITSDNPFTIFPPKTYNPNTFLGSAVGILTPGARKSIPISPRASLFMCDHGGRYAENIVPRDKMRIFNDFYARTSDRFIFARDEALLRSIVERSRVDEIPLERERVIIS